jgi:hypothetical protein
MPLNPLEIQESPKFFNEAYETALQYRLMEQQAALSDDDR